MKNLKKILFLIVLTLKVFSVGSVYAAEKTSDASAKFSFAYSGANKVVDVQQVMSLVKQREAVRRMLEKYNSPLLGEVDSFIVVAQKYRLPVYFLPSIAGLESSFAKYEIPGNYNSWGWGSGTIQFRSYAHAIDTIGRALRERYVVDGSEVDPWKVGPIYAESPTWALRVENFMKQFEREEQSLSSILSTNNI